jgi:hypothetical protein
VPILSQIDPVHTIPFYLSKIHFNITHPTVLVFIVVSFLLAFPSIFYEFLFSTFRAKCPCHLILLDLIIVMMVGEGYKL